MADYHKEPIEHLLEEICKIFPEKYKRECDSVMKIFAPIIVALLEAGLSPDEVCREISFCKDFKQCTLYDKKEEKKERVPKISKEKKKFYVDCYKKIISFVNINPDVYPPDHDDDGDWFATHCNDKNNKIYPGKKENPTIDTGVDYNCNGISGVNEKGESYEDLFCGNVTRRGIAVVDFHIPKSWMMPNATLDMFKYVGQVVEFEADWPQLAMFGGYKEEDETELTFGPIRSMYKYLRKHNLCNHRDYQTLCINGGDSHDMVSFAKGLRRDQNNDHPLLFVISLFGDDVCSAHQDFDHMTTTEEFEKNIMETLSYLDSVLPKNSHVVGYGIFDGTLLWKFLYNEEHPLGMKYSKVYDFLNCLKVNQCWGWLNSNETIRNLTQKRADELSALFQSISEKHKQWTNFKMHYVSLAESGYELLDYWKKQGKNPKDLVESVDGFHPGQQALPLLADIMYQKLLKIDPEIFGEVNPNNDKIKDMFGDQGGY